MPSFNSESDQLTVVMVGSFNPAIFHPEWFLRQEIITLAQLNDASKVEVLSPDIARIELSGLALEVLQERLTLATRDSSKIEFLQDTILAVLAKLPHIPLRACGLNSSHVYQAGSEKLWHKIGHTLAPKSLIWQDLLEKPGLETMTIKGERSGDYPGYVNVTVQSEAGVLYGLRVSSNTHYGSVQKEVLEISKVCDYIRSEWKEAFQVAQKTANLIFKRITVDD